MNRGELLRRVQAHEPWACPDCVPDLGVAVGVGGALTVTVRHSVGCEAIAYWLLLAKPGRPPGTGPVNPHDPFTEEDTP